MRPVRATVRLQFHAGYTLDDALAQVPYFADLGLSHVYASPLLTARAGSMHGYDGVDPTRISEALGGEAALRRLVAALHKRGMGLIVDIVPNHLAIGPENPWWMDVLAWGERSRHAQWFDIDWRPLDRALHGKVLLPVLGKPYGEALADGELSLVQEHGRWYCAYYEHRFPIVPDELPSRLKAAQEGTTGLHALLEHQNWRLAWWRTASDEINWRRFFDVHELIGMNVQREEVFEALHGKVLQLVGEGLIDGLRIDHIDGLADPAGYTHRLRERIGPDVYLVVEKILADGERLPADWTVDGTTGYDFMNQVSEWLHAPAGEAPLGQTWAECSGRSAVFAPEAEQARREILPRSFSAQLEANVAGLHKAAREQLATRDTSAAALRRALVELLVHYPVYRPYAADDAPLRAAAEGARERIGAHDRPAVDRLLAGLQADPAALRRFAHLSAPLAAKAIEDTAFYRYGRLLSRNDVGFEPAHFSCSADDFHRQCMERAASHPQAMLATATHDHKRGEDVRARLSVLSFQHEAWRDALGRWRGINAGLRPAEGPSAGDEAILYQTLIGTWPTGLGADDAAGLRAYAERIVRWQEKALREAKLRTDWLAVDERYEAACRGFVEALLDPARSADFLAELTGFVAGIADLGRIHGLLQVALKYTVPGVPDLYQGCEDEDLSLVDPDNRRPVDWPARAQRLDGSAGHGLQGLHDPALKQQLIARLLAARRTAPALFSEGRYEPLPGGDDELAFERRHGAQVLRVRMARGRSGGLPEEAETTGWRDLLAGLPAMPLSIRLA